MALPTTPTATLLATEALARLNEPSPSPGMLARAEDILIGVVNTIAKRGNWRVLEKVKTTVLTPYTPQYAIPADFGKGLTFSLFSGGHTGAMQAATASSITLEAGEDITAAVAQGSPIFMTSGNAMGYWSYIINYNATTKAAGIAPNWLVTPTSGNYIIPSEELDLPYRFQSRIKTLDSVGKPQVVGIYDDEIVLSPVPNTGPYVLMSRFQLKPYQIDLTDTRMSRIYWDWREALLLGIIRDYAYTPDDDRYKQASADFERAVQELSIEEKRRSRI